MKICLGQINTTPGDFSGNLTRMQRGIDVASAAGCDLVLFPELSIPGYLSQDLLYNHAYVERNLEVLEALIQYAAGADVPAGLHIIAGYLGRHEGAGKPFTNMAGVIRNGELGATYQKQLLPFYDVFDELRYFQPGDDTLVLDIAGQSVGIAICEDLWNDKAADDYNYDDNPMQQYRDAGVDLVLSLNSSPYVLGKCRQRLEHIVPATQNGPAVAYVNQVGGQDELVFDGQSFVASQGRVRYLSREINEDSFDIVDLDLIGKDTVAPGFDPAELSDSHLVSATDLIVLGLRDYAVKSGFSQLVLASSGGVDSAVVCKLACDALGPENVHAIRMPSIFSSDHASEDAKVLHKNLGCWDYEVPVGHESVVDFLNGHYRTHSDNANLVTRVMTEQRYSTVADENIQARLRDVYLMHFSNAYGAMPLSTGNKTEAGCGYYTHFDMNFSFAPIKDLYKFQVVDIAREDPRIPDNIWQKPPSAELAAGQTDEASLLPYPVLDPIVMAYVEYYITTWPGFCDWVDEHVKSSGLKISGDSEVLSRWLLSEGADQEYLRIISLIGKMEYKRRQTCPGVKVSRVAFGIGRRIPIVEKWS